ncbi:MAG TPA: NADH-quinone oxidoreductase subunit D [Planctomycetota bacterium]|jgi:NADH-quinone oxidoreductase subunit D|nr:NADH-quinone oxidoreductase subunit D [Planctomycetota bacterium]
MTESLTLDYERGAIHEDDPLHGELMQLNVGPQHPATHGVLRLKVTLDGETMREIEPVVGYLHRGKEKTCETLGWRKFFVHTDRLDYVQPLLNNCAYALALEKLAGLEIPERGKVIRVLLMELSRIAAHLIYLGTTGIDLGAVTMFFFCFNEREKLYDLLDAYTGHRMNNTYVRIGGVYADVDASVQGAIEAFLDQFPAKVDEFERMLTGNRIWFDRNRAVGVLTREQALAWSLTGPNLRGSGVEHDLRRAAPYSGYETYDFEVPVGTVGDCYDRYLVRVEEMRQSTRICKQALARLTETRGGDFLAQDRRYVLPPKSEMRASMEELIHQFKIVTDMALPAGEAYGAVESSKGELGFYVVSDGTSHPVRCHIRAPGLMNVQAIPTLARGRLLSDMVAIIGSLDFVMGEVDR